MNINDKVKSKNKNGMFQETGTVKAIFDANFYQSTIKVDLNSTWGKQFPDWKNKSVVAVMFDVCKKTATEQEWIDSAKLQGKDPSDYENCPSTNLVVIPIDDLEIVNYD